VAAREQDQHLQPHSTFYPAGEDDRVLSQRDDVGRLGFYPGMRSISIQENRTCRHIQNHHSETCGRVAFALAHRDYGHRQLCLCSKHQPLADRQTREADYRFADPRSVGGLQDADGHPDNHRRYCERQNQEPALFGFVRPRLLLPQGMLETYSLENLRYVFIHELAHLRQRDIYLGWLMALLQVVHWFNPLMWFAFGRMRADRELACDTLAISTLARMSRPNMAGPS